MGGEIFMGKRIYISADYSEDNGDREVIEIINQWNTSLRHSLDIVDMSQVISGSVSNGKDCYPCDLKEEFNRQINASSTVVFIVGDKTALRKAGSSCSRNNYSSCNCTPYKQNSSGTKVCKVYNTVPAVDDIGNINSYSYIEHEFKQAEKKRKNIIIFYNSLQNQNGWLPSYMKNHENNAYPFWVKNIYEIKVGNYNLFKSYLEK